MRWGKREKAAALLAATALALGAILLGALFLIAPVWQPGYSPAAYAAPFPQPESAGEEAGVSAAPVNVNTADAETLMTLDGIGPAKAQAILDYRAANGPFAAVEDMEKVSGISSRMVAQWGDAVTVGDAGQ